MRSFPLSESNTDGGCSTIAPLNRGDSENNSAVMVLRKNDHCILHENGNRAGENEL